MNKNKKNKDEFKIPVSEAKEMFDRCNRHNKDYPKGYKCPACSEEERQAKG